MAAISQYREPERAATEVCSFASGDTHPGGALLCVQLSTPSQVGEHAGSIWHSNSPAVLLTMDLLAASGAAAAGPQGSLYVADFPSVPSAFSAARRLLWAFQGLAESGEFVGNSVAVSLQSGDETVGLAVFDTLAGSLQQAQPGQILVTEKTSQSLSEVPGLSFQPTATPQVLELLWRDGDERVSRFVDEQTLAQLMEKHGLGDQIYGERPSESSFAFGSPSSQPEPEWTAKLKAGNWTEQFLHGNGRWILAGACAVLLAVVAVIVYSSHGSTANSNPVVVAPDSATSTQSPAAGSDQQPPEQHPQPSESAKTDKQSQPNAQKLAQKTSLKVVPAQASGPVAPPAPRAVEPPVQREPAQRGGRCDDMDESMIPAALDQAEKSLARGKYDAAQRQFGSVLGCQPSNGRARDGLERVRRAKEAESHSSN